MRVAEPLPECSKCSRPTRRTVHSATGGLCTACSAWDHSVAVIGPRDAEEERRRLHEWQTTVHRIRRAEAIAAAERAQRRRMMARRRRA